MVQDGIGYIRNHGDSPSYLKSAFDNFTEASRLGDAVGMNCLGTCYERGYGCIKDYQKAAKNPLLRNMICGSAKVRRRKIPERVANWQSNLLKGMCQRLLIVQ